MSQHMSVAEGLQTLVPVHVYVNLPDYKWAAYIQIRQLAWVVLFLSTTQLVWMVLPLYIRQLALVVLSLNTRQREWCSS